MVRPDGSLNLCKWALEGMDLEDDFEEMTETATTTKTLVATPSTREESMVGIDADNMVIVEPGILLSSVVTSACDSCWRHLFMAPAITLLIWKCAETDSTRIEIGPNDLHYHCPLRLCGISYGAMPCCSMRWCKVIAQKDD